MIKLLRDEFPSLSIHRMGQLLGVHRSLVYRESQKKECSVPLEPVERIVTKYLGYGYRRVHLELAKQDIQTTQYSVRKFLKEQGLLARRPRSKGVTRSRVLDYRSCNLLKGFQVSRPDEVWAVDTTLIRTSSGPVYMANLLDIFTRRVVAWSLSKRNDLALTMDCLNKALELRRPDLGWVHHSDQGSTYTAQAYVKRIRDAGGRVSYTKPGSPRENAFAESFFRTLKLEEVDRNQYENLLEVETAIAAYIELYNMTRMHSSLEYLSPNEFESRFVGGAA